MNSREIIDETLRRTGLSLEQLAERLGKKIRTLKGIRSGEIPMAEDVRLHIQDLVALSANQALEGGHAAAPRVGEEMENFARSGARGLLKARRQELGLSLEEVARRTGYQKSAIRNLEEGHTRGSEKLLAALARALDLPLEQLMEGSDLPRLVGFGRTFGARPNVTTPPGVTAHTIPLISWAQAGDLQTWDDVYEHEGIVAYNTKDPKALAVSIRGDSMSPDYKEGTIAIIYPSFQAKSGDLVIARLSDGSVLFKRLQINGDEFTFVSLNPVYPPIVVDKSKVEKLVPVGATQRVEL